MVDTANTVSLSGMTENEAEEFHKYYIQGATMFTAVAVVAHILVWLWRPWIPGPEGYTSLSDTVTTVASLASPFIG